MADKTRQMITTMAAILGLIAIIASPIVSVAIGMQIGKDAKHIAVEAKTLAEQNARDFAFFKGEVNAKLDNLIKGQDRTLEFMSNLERTGKSWQEQK